MPEETLQVLLPSVQVSGIDLRKRQLTPEWNDYLAASRTNWVKQNINNPNELFDPKKAKTRTNLTDSDWDYIYSQHPEYFDPAGKYRKQVPDKYLSRQFNKGIRDATSEAAPIILPWIMGFMNPFAVGAGLASLMTADEITNKVSSGKYQDFTQFTTDKLGTVAGTIVGMAPGMVGGSAAGIATPTMSLASGKTANAKLPSIKNFGNNIKNTYNFTKTAASKVGTSISKPIRSVLEKPIQAVKAIKENYNMDYIPEEGVYYTGSPNRNITAFKPGPSGGIFFTSDPKAARGFTGTFGTGKVYRKGLDLGNSPVVIDAMGKSWAELPETSVADAFGLSKEELFKVMGDYSPISNPSKKLYNFDLVAQLGKELNRSSVTLKNAQDVGRSFFSTPKTWDLTVIFDPKQIKDIPRYSTSVKIAQPGDKGTLLENYIGNIIYKSGGKLNYTKFF